MIQELTKVIPQNQKTTFIAALLRSSWEQHLSHIKTIRGGGPLASVSYSELTKAKALAVEVMQDPHTYTHQTLFYASKLATLDILGASTKLAQQLGEMPSRDTLLWSFK